MQTNHVDSQNAHPTSGIAASGPASIDPDIESDSDPSAPANGHRDSVGSIIDDPFFQTYDPAVQAAAVSEDEDQSDGSSVYQSLEDEDHEHLFHDTKGHNFGKAAKQAKRKSGGGKKVKPDSDDNEPSQYWPPPRRESLTATPSSYWVCNHVPSHAAPP